MQWERVRHRNHKWMADRCLRENSNVSSKDKRNAGFRCFQGHLTQELKTPTCNLNTDLLLIPGGKTSLLHVLLMWYLKNHSNRSTDHTRGNYLSVTCSLCGSSQTFQRWLLPVWRMAIWELYTTTRKCNTFWGTIWALA